MIQSKFLKIENVTYVFYVFMQVRFLITIKWLANTCIKIYYNITKVKIS